MKKTDIKSTVETIIKYMPDSVRPALSRSRPAYGASLRELTLRAGRPVCLYLSDGRRCITESGCLADDPCRPDLLITSAADISDTFLKLCDYSVYSRQNEYVNGYITAGGGIRVGLCGTAVIQNGSVKNIRNISSLSFRVPREVIGCADELLGIIDTTRGALICGPPCSGKTTLIRDLARKLSYVYRVSVIDERGELSASRGTLPGFDLGLCDIYVDMPKGEAIIDSVRGMSPDIIICDELGDERDADSIRYALRCGVSFIASVHASSVDDLRLRPVTRELLGAGAFGYLVIMSGRNDPGKVARVYRWSDNDA